MKPVSIWQSGMEGVPLVSLAAQEREREGLPAHPNFWRVYEGKTLRANQSTMAGALHYMKPGRVLVPPKKEG